MGNSTDRRQLRKTLLDNGYRPLPLLDKGIRIKGWSTADINLEWIEQFKRSGRYKNTGIRCDDLIAFDIDVLDEALADKIERRIEQYLGRTDYCRIGQWPKRLLLYRLAGEPIRSARTGKYDGHQVELLAGSGRQFAAFGIHPGTGKPYEWEGCSPENRHIDRLPPVDSAEAQNMLDTIEAEFVKAGLQRSTPGGTLGTAGQSLYDLLPDTQCQIDGAIVPWAELREQLTDRGVWGNVKRENGEFGDSNGVHFYRADGSGAPCAHDFPRDATHWEAIAVPGNVAAVLNKPSDSSLFGPPVNSAPVDPLDVLLDEWVLFYDKTVRALYMPTDAYKLDAFKAVNKHEWTSVPTASGRPKRMLAVDAWQNDRRTKRAHSAELRPDQPDLPMFEEQRKVVFNTYRRPEHPASGGEADTFDEFINHLIPDPIECDLFLDWLALKLQNPSYRMHAFVMVTPQFGTGRGTLVQIIERLFGIQYVNSIEYDDIFGESSQSTFNAYMADSLLVSVNEVYDKSAKRTDWESRRTAYERIKHLCETVARPMYIKRKLGHNSTVMVYASLLIASNHEDALAIEPGDRRIIVIDNTRTRLTQAANGLYQRIHQWQLQPENIGALYRELMARAASGSIVYQPHDDPPDTSAKRRMIDAGKSELDRLYEHFLADARGDICTHYQWQSFVYREAQMSDIDLPNGEQLKRGLVAVLQKNARRFSHLPNGQMRINKHPERPWIIRNFEHWERNTIADDIRAEVEKNGPTRATVTPLKPQ